MVPDAFCAVSLPAAKTSKTAQITIVLFRKHSLMRLPDIIPLLNAIPIGE